MILCPGCGAEVQAQKYCNECQKHVEIGKKGDGEFNKILPVRQVGFSEDAWDKYEREMDHKHGKI